MMSVLPSLKKNEELKWSVHDSKVNLAALLNDPRKVKRDYDLFTKTWGETFRDIPTGSSIRRSKWVPNVQKGHFSDYLSKTGDQLLRHDSQSLKNLHRTESDNAAYSGMSDFLSKKSAAIKTAVTAQQEREAVIKTRLALDALPKIFLRTDFDMGNPQVFASVLNVSSPDDKFTAVEGKHKDMSASKMLQEKLNHYLDRVEMAIVRQISLQSDAFFKAMSSHEELHDYLNKTMSSLQSLMNKLKNVKKNIAENSLQVLNLQRSHVNAVSLLQRLHMMVTVHQTQPTIQLLLSTSEYAGSLDLIRTTQEVLHLELAGLQCFRHLSSQLAEMEKVIGQMMKQEMDECLRDEIHRSVTEGHMCRDPHRLAAVMLGLLRQGQFEFLQEFREEIEIAVKSIIRDTVSDAVGFIDQDKNETLASRMRMMDFLDWLALLDELFQNLLIFLRRVKSVLDLLSSVAQDSVARGDVFRLSKIRKIDRISLRKKRRLKSTRRESNSRSKNTVATENNPFLDSAAGSDPTEDSSSPLPGNSEKNPFLSSPQHRALENDGVDSSNPFTDDLEDGTNGDFLMDGLASYEDELINSAADSFVPALPSHSRTERVEESLNPQLEEEVFSNHIDEKTSVVEVATEDIATSEECDGFLFAIRDLLHWTLDFQQDRCVKVLIAKGKDSSLDKLSSSNFLKLAKIIERFIAEGEEIVLENSSSAGNDNTRLVHSSLRGALQTQASKFVSRFHEERRNKLSLILDNELWKQAEVPVELWRLLTNLVAGKVSSAHEDAKVPAMNGDVREQNNAKEHLELDGDRYVVVGTVLILLKMVSEYCKCADDLPASTPDLINRLRELLTLFNSRTCQLVLGAGALQLVGLKTITTKHLALASRCLQLVLHCIPSVRRHFELKLSLLNQSHDDKSHNKHSGALRHFDHVTKDYQDHVNEVGIKLTAIVMSVVERQLVKWEVKAPVPSPAFRNICKQITKFYDTVSSMLPQKQICQILLTLTDELKSKLRVILRSFNVRNDGGPQHGLVTSDLAFFEANIKSLRGMEMFDLKMNSVWS